MSTLEIVLAVAASVVGLLVFSLEAHGRSMKDRPRSERLAIVVIVVVLTAIIAALVIHARRAPPQDRSQDGQAATHSSVEPPTSITRPPPDAPQPGQNETESRPVEEVARASAPADTDDALKDQTIQPDGEKRRFVNKADGLTYAWIPPGRFLMGCSSGDSECSEDELPAHYVTIWEAFRIATTEVTQEAYRKVMGRLPLPEEFGFPPSDLQAKFDALTGGTPGASVGHKFPVEHVRYQDAEEYCEKIGMRLPTEAEWEYAARGGTSGTHYGDLGSIAWWGGSHASGIHEVGLKQPNAYGLYDMLGNVREWTSDKYPNDWEGKRVVRGGDWATNSRDIRVSTRDKDTNIPRGGPVCFRCVRPMASVQKR